MRRVLFADEEDEKNEEEEFGREESDFIGKVAGKRGGKDGERKFFECFVEDGRLKGQDQKKREKENGDTFPERGWGDEGFKLGNRIFHRSYHKMPCTKERRSQKRGFVHVEC